ncbi:MAG: amidohydrolase, partial [Rhizorhabdus sp.]|nr:amidohydrolase [Rhizorhabdus sp.]
TEMKLMRQALGWPGLLASLTTAPAKKFGEEGERGRIAPGFIADLVILGGDPSLDVAAMSDVRRVIRSGRIVFDRP